MKKLAFLLWLIPALAFAQSSPNWPLGYNPTVPEISTTFSGKQDYGGAGVLSSLTIKNPTTGATTPVLFATSYGVRADGVTSDDAAMLAAFNACAAASAKLVLPPGKILMNGTGSSTISIQDCSIEGQGVGPLINGDANSIGTTVYLTSTSIAPFKIGGQWSMKGVNFYWPNQGATNGTLTVTQSGTVVTVSAISGWTLAVGDYIVPTNGKYGAEKITSLGSGSGGTGTYNVAQSQTLGSQTAYSTRITVYPALFTCGGTGGSTGCAAFRLENVNLINAYDGLVATSPNINGAWWWYHSRLYALHDLIKDYEAGDFIQVIDNIYNFGDWMALTGFSQASKTAGSAAGQQNSVFHATSLSGGSAIGGALSGSAFGYRYGILMDSGSQIANMRINLNFDGVGSWLDATAGGTFSGETNVFHANGDCALINFNGEGTGNNPCIALGANGNFVTVGLAGSSPGTFLTTTGARVSMTGSTISSVGSVADGSEYYVISASGGAQLLIGDNQFSGQANSHTHGVLQTQASAYTRISNNKFSNFNDALNLTFGGGRNIVSGNHSDGTFGAASISLPGGAAVSYFGNNWDKPPVSAVSSCGGTPSISGTFSGRIGVGTGTVTSCVITLPFGLTGQLGGQCVFNLSAGAASPAKMWANLTATGPSAYTISTDVDMHGSNIDFVCSAEQ